MSTKHKSTAAVAVQEKRRERRYPTNDAVEVRTFPYTGITIPANIVDVSRSGMKLEVPTPWTPGARIEILMPFSKLVVFAEVRYCRRFGAVYQAGVLIEDVVQPKPETKHLHDDETSLYVVGKGLSAAEVIRVETHLLRCARCKQRVVEAAKTLNPIPRPLRQYSD